MSKLTLAVALALVTSSAIAAPSELQRQLEFARLHGESRALPRAPETTASAVTADELKGLSFQDGTGSTLRVAKDGSWEGESPSFQKPWLRTKLAGPSFELHSTTDRQVLTFKLSDEIVRAINDADRDARPLQALVSRLGTDEQAELPKEFGPGWHMGLVVVYGNLAEGQVLGLVGK